MKRTKRKGPKIVDLKNIKTCLGCLRLVKLIKTEKECRLIIGLESDSSDILRQKLWFQKKREKKVNLILVVSKRTFVFFYLNLRHQLNFLSPFFQRKNSQKKRENNYETFTQDMFLLHLIMKKNLISREIKIICKYSSLKFTKSKKKLI